LASQLRTQPIAAVVSLRDAMPNLQRNAAQSMPVVTSVSPSGGGPRRMSFESKISPKPSEKRQPMLLWQFSNLGSTVVESKSALGSPTRLRTERPHVGPQIWPGVHARGQ